MTPKEFKLKIASAEESEWFSNISVTFNYFYLGQEVNLIGFASIFEYVFQQLEGWESQEKDLPNELLNSGKYFAKINNLLTQNIAQYVKYDKVALNNFWASAQTSFNVTPYYPIPFNAPEADFLIRVFKEIPKSFSSAFSYITTKDGINLSNKDAVLGTLLAYEYSQKTKSDIAARRNDEKAALQKHKNNLHKYISDSENFMSEHFNGINIKYNELVNKFDTLIAEKNDLYNTWFDNTKKTKWEGWYGPVQTQIKELEETYKQKLKLEEPAMYWSQRATSLKKQGWWTLCIILILLLITCWSLGKLLWTTPDQIYLSWFSDDKSAAIRWAIVYVTLISFIAFGLRSLIKIMFSSFHLARDCEERFTLTYFYLSLLKDSQVTETDRQLIMQSLFSRAETGLLKEDSSPTMPSEILNRFTAK